MSKKAKGSLLSRIASCCGLLSICTVVGWYFSSLPGIPTATFILHVFCGILTPLLAITGITLGIIELCTLNPEEKKEEITKSGTTKTNAWAGVIASLYVLAFFAYIVILTILRKF